MHDYEATRGNKKIAHLRKSSLIKRKDEHVQDDIFGYDSFCERVIIFFSSYKVFNILSLW
jgi:hypothetical protein